MSILRPWFFHKIFYVSTAGIIAGAHNYYVACRMYTANMFTTSKQTFKLLTNELRVLVVAVLNDDVKSSNRVTISSQCLQKSRMTRNSIKSGLIESAHYSHPVFERFH